MNVGYSRCCNADVSEFVMYENIDWHDCHHAAWLLQFISRGGTEPTVMRELETQAVSSG